VHWLLPLPTGLHVLTAAVDGEAKLWTACPSSSSRSSSGSSAAGRFATVCCTLQPPAADRQECALGCRPALSSDGRFVVCGGPSGTLACYDLQQLQRRAHLPLSQRSSNAAAACQLHTAAVTAVATGCADTLLVSGDASGRLVVRWR